MAGGGTGLNRLIGGDGSDGADEISGRNSGGSGSVNVGGGRSGSCVSRSS